MTSAPDNFETIHATAHQHSPRPQRFAASVLARWKDSAVPEADLASIACEARCVIALRKSSDGSRLGKSDQPLRQWRLTDDYSPRRPSILRAPDHGCVQKVISNTKGSLIYATEAGELLNSAKKAIAKKGEWLRWLGHNLPAIPQTTASLYMRLAENKEVIDKQRVANAIDEGALSIRAAAKFIAPSATAKAAAARRASTLAEKKAVAAANQIEDLLRDLAVDEVYTALKSTHDVGSCWSWDK